MKTILLFLSLFSFFYLPAQNFEKEWKQVVQNEIEGKTKSANEIVDKIYKTAHRKDNDVQIIRCFFYQSKFIQKLEENAQVKIIDNLQNEIRTASKPNKALLNYLYADLLNKYEQYHRYTINKRTSTATKEANDFLAWTSADFVTEISNAYGESLENHKILHNYSLTDYREVLEISPYTDIKNSTLFDFILEKNLTYQKSKSWLRDSDYEQRKIFSDALLLLPKEFALFSSKKLSDAGLKKILQLLQLNESYYILHDTEKLDFAYFERLKLYTDNHNEPDGYLMRIKALEVSTHNHYLKQQLRTERAEHLFNMTEKGNPKNYYPDALKLIDSILLVKSNPNAMAEAEIIRNKILHKSLTIQTKKAVYPNENIRAFVEFRNVDSVTISYYRLPTKMNALFNNYNYREIRRVNRDSLALSLISKNKPVVRFLRVLPDKKDHFNYSTEILLEKMDVGNYLVFIETANNAASRKKVFTYEVITSSNINFLQYKDRKNDTFHLADRKTGKPLENVIAINNETQTKSDKKGKVAFRKINSGEGDYWSDVRFIKENDTLLTYYAKNYLYDAPDENFEAKCRVYFDRAIYRPGQKVYFKGILMQKKGIEKSVVPFVTVKIIIEDPEENTIKEFDVQTNEFGSFTSEFDIPKNVLTGAFSVIVEEPEKYNKDTKYYDAKEDEHSFWDNVDYNDRENFTFQVEEYKRPTFEVKFDDIKENYTIGDVIRAKGNAKTLAGSNLTNAKVAYTISKNVNGSQDYDSEENYINTETTTDANGDFFIEFTANDTDFESGTIQSMRFSIQTSVTDTNGETRTANKTIHVGQKMMQLQSSVNGMYLENPLEIKINATNLNDYPVDTKGEIAIYHLEKKEYLLTRLYQIPEIPTLSRAEFESLFPYEPYDSSDSKVTEKLIKTLDFDTKNSKTTTIQDIRNWKKGDYKIRVSATDPKNNAIDNESSFSLQSKVNIASGTEPFTFSVNIDKADYFEVTLNSAIPDLYITTRFYLGTDDPEEFGLQLINGSAKLKIKKMKDYKNDVHFHFSSFWENRYFTKNYTISKQNIEKKLEIEVISLRNKIEPASQETWSFKIKDPKMEAEFLASMYDSSLDEFRKDTWESIGFYDYRSRPNYPYQYNYNEARLIITDFYSDNIYYKNHAQKPDFYWFGFDFINPNNPYLTKKYIQKVTMIAEAPKNAKMISGYLSDLQGPLPGANVVVKGTTRGVQTDFDGYYEIEVSKGETLEFSFVGMVSQQVKIEDNKVYNMVLTQSDANLEEVVVVGYETVAKKSMVASSVTVTADTLKNRPNAALLQALAGNAAGLNVGSGNPGPPVLIRGAASSTNTEPLFIVDGVAITRDEFLKLNPDEINSITVLKDAASTAVYGNRGANGVIVILTKNALKELATVKTRTNFKETAFFYPQLKTDAGGKISFSFTTPESLTQWNLRLYAHNKKAQTGYYQTNVISQKDVMIMPNMPRFVREKDVLTISAKVVNMTGETKTGLAMLMLYDAVSMKPIDSLALNKNNVVNFSCKPKESIPVKWTITIPEHLQGLQYKIVAKSGDFTDGEENILPVLTNKILITESIPLWVRGNTKKEYVFENMKNTTSTTLQNHSMTLEYTTNPTWLALQSLPYLMEYQYECAEQTFARYYANHIATEVINSNPKIAALFESWKTKATPKSRFEMNEELKSIVLSESPWLLDAQSEEEKNKRLAVLFDLNTLKEKDEATFEKLMKKLLPSGGFAWFDGGTENNFISQHILSGIGHLNKLFPKNSAKYDIIINKGVPNLDSKFVSANSSANKMFYYNQNNLHYLYTRSFFIDKFPLSKKADSVAKLKIQEYKKDWLTYSLYQKATLALAMHRFGEREFAKKIMVHFKESSSTNVDYGMYWIENSGGYYWYNSPIETQALLIEAFSEIENDKQSIEAMKVWLIKNKQSQHWSTTKSTSEAIYALLLQGDNWASVKENTKIKIGDEKLFTKKLAEKQDEAAIGYFKLNWKKEEINPKMATISIDNKSDVPGYGGVYWQYFENLENIKSDSTATLSISKKIFRKVKTAEGNQLVELGAEPLKVGDLITIRLIVRSKDNLEFVHLKDLRASCFEPVDVISNYHWGENTSYYKSTKDVATNFFFDNLNKGTYVFEYDVRVNNSGTFNDGIATIQSMYAPEYGAHSTSVQIKAE